ncbi:YidB family protein [Methylobacterium sp. J-026]|uniref:YidB family protein n=1 Tax=Methylobacterium sp. J-026 TaxID=2836624 RepID=UPI001FBA62C7|nr:YidB family protein [Methylobacterium sp. J-026]MCJ2135059.1 YidB family protein [Methylobacterium sp. J-026]
MSEGYPSMTALLGLLAVAGYQHRDKISEWLGSHGENSSAAPRVPPVSAGSGTAAPGNLDRLLGGAGSVGVGGLLAHGIGELVNHFGKGGHAETAQSWIDHGPNRDIPAADLERVIGPETLTALEQRTGLSRSELVARLSRDLPSAIDRYSPDGRLPALG